MILLKLGGVFLIGIFFRRYVVFNVFNVWRDFDLNCDHVMRDENCLLVVVVFVKLILQA